MHMVTRNHHSATQESEICHFNMLIKMRYLELFLSYVNFVKIYCHKFCLYIVDNDNNSIVFKYTCFCINY